MPRYLKLRHRTWYFSIDVPAELRVHFDGKAKVVKTTGSQDLNVAQALALRWAGDYKKQFNALRAGRATTDPSPRDVYKNKLAALEAGSFDVTLLPTDADSPDDPEGLKAMIEIDELFDRAPIGPDATSSSSTQVG